MISVVLTMTTFWNSGRQRMRRAMGLTMSQRRRPHSLWVFCAEAGPAPDCGWIHTERSKPGVTLALLHLEYLAQHPAGYRYTQFCERYRRWLARRGLTMRQVHRAGEKCFVDYAGHKPTLLDAATGELLAVELFVAVLGASSHTYAEAFPSQELEHWISGHVHAFEAWGGVTRIVVPDNARTAVTQAHRYLI